MPLGIGIVERRWTRRVGHDAQSRHGITRFDCSRTAHENHPRIKEKWTRDLTCSAPGSRHELQAAPTIFGEDDRGAVGGESDHLTTIAVIEAAEAATGAGSKVKGLHYQRPQLPAAYRE